MHPRPATIDPGAEEMSRESACRLLARIERPHDDPGTVMVTPKLVKGE
jgi:DNA-binding LacI/PurR family transcriptional regulator